ncbi:MAG: beta-ketoacyl-[acyl-carrier-protein] synthase family protein [Pseudomonadota bacterium]
MTTTTTATSAVRRVAITGLGTVSPLGNTPHEAFERARDGVSAVQRLTTPIAAQLAAPLAATARLSGDNHFDPAKLRMLDRFSLFALVAANQAMADARGSEQVRADAERVGVFVGSAMGGSHSMDEAYLALYGAAGNRIKPFTVLMGMHNAAAAWIAMEHGIRGANLTFSTACSSSAVAIGEAWQRVARGELDLAIAGGSEAPLSNGSLKAWEAMHTLATPDPHDDATSCKPFSKNRSGMVLGEGAAMLVLEPWEQAQARGVPIHGELLGYGVTNDPGHVTKPSVEGQAAAMQACLKAAALAREQIDGVNAHGTGTQANDVTETSALRAVFGPHAQRLAVSATKAVHGHLLGGGGALECLLSLLAMRHGVVLPTMHLHQPDPQCDLDYVPNTARHGVAVRTMLSNSFAFGGTNAVLALGAGAAA